MSYRVKRFRLPLLAAIMAVPAILFSGGATQAAAQTVNGQCSKSALASAFIHVATAGNTLQNYTDIDSAATNNKPNAILEVTPNWAPYHIYDNHPIGVWYHNGKWSVFNQDMASMPDHAAFNVRVLSASRSAFIHVAASANSHGNYTDIDSTATNNKPAAILLVTPNWAPHHVYDRHPIGVWYHNGKWSIFNQDMTRIPRRAAFNVQVLKASASNFIHVATAANSWDDFTDIDNPATNSRPTAIVFVTPNWAPHSVYNNHPIGVWYDVAKWSIFNQDLTAIPDQAAFNVSVSGGAL